MSNYLKKLIVKPGSKIRLKHFDPGYHGKHESHKSALPEIEEKEPNDSLFHPQPLPAGPVAVLGNLDKDGVDVFQLDGRAGERWQTAPLSLAAGASLDVDPNFYVTSRNLTAPASAPAAPASR